MPTAYKIIGGDTALHMQAFGDAVSRDDSTLVKAALGVGDTIDLTRIAGGTRAQTLRIKNDDLDTGATLVVKIGYRPADSGGVLQASDAAFGAGLTLFQAAGLTDLAIDPVNFNEDVIVFATVTAAAAGMAAGNKKVTTFATGIARGVK